MDSTKKMSIQEVLATQGKLIYSIRGVSMLPLLRQAKDLAVIVRKEPGVPCKKYDAVLFRRDNGQYVLHRIAKVGQGDYFIIGDNCLTGETVREDQILGILTQVIRDGKTVNVTDPGYLCYVHLWCDFPRTRRLCFRLRNYAKAAVRKLIRR